MVEIKSHPAKQVCPALQDLEPRPGWRPGPQGPLQPFVIGAPYRSAPAGDADSAMHVLLPLSTLHSSVSWHPPLQVYDISRKYLPTSIRWKNAKRRGSSACTYICLPFPRFVRGTSLRASLIRVNWCYAATSSATCQVLLNAHPSPHSTDRTPPDSCSATLIRLLRYVSMNRFELDGLVSRTLTSFSLMARHPFYRVVQQRLGDVASAQPGLQRALLVDVVPALRLVSC